jgi:hypothetical protein
MGDGREKRDVEWGREERRGRIGNGGRRDGKSDRIYRIETVQRQYGYI